MSVFSIQRLENARELPLPNTGTALSAGYDLSAAIDEKVILSPGARCLVPCGFAIALAPGFEGQIRGRSGLAFKYGVTVLNAPGTIDADYRGELKVILINHGQEDFVIEPGMRIAQLVIARHVAVQWEEVENLETVGSRDAAGFGSTGLYVQKNA